MPDPDVCQRAEQLLEVGRAEAAIDLLTRQLASDPDDAWALRLLSAANADLERYADSLRWADRAVSVEPLAANSWHHRAAALLGLDRIDEAVAAARRAIELAPNDWTEHYLLGQTLERSPGGEREILAVARTTVDLAPNEAQAHVLLGIAHDLVGEQPAAIAAYRGALAIDPQNSPARNNLAVIDLRDGRHEQALPNLLLGVGAVVAAGLTLRGSARKQRSGPREP